MKEKLSIASVNAMSESAFIDTFKEIYEHSAWVAEQVFPLKPFKELEHLHEAMVNIVRQSSEDAQLVLLRAHPELTGRASLGDELTRHSASEQHQAGLNECTQEQLDLLHKYNERYRAKFTYPFIVAVRGMDVDEIINMLRTRSGETDEEEFSEALEQVYKIAKFRLGEIVEN